MADRKVVLVITNYLADRMGVGQSQWQQSPSQVMYGSLAPAPNPEVQQGSMVPLSSMLSYGDIGIDPDAPDLGTGEGGDILSATGSQSYGEFLGGVGSVASMLGVAPFGIGALGAGVGTAIDYSRADDILSSYNNDPVGGVQAPQISFGDILSGFGNALTGGRLGTSLDTAVQTGIAQAIAQATNTGLTPSFMGGFGFDMGIGGGGYGDLGPEGTDFGGGYGL
jgi:hypothetical protein